MENETADTTEQTTTKEAKGRGSVIRQETARVINGVAGRAYNVIASGHAGTVASQSWKACRTYEGSGRRYRIIVTIRHDDDCGNGHNSFSITGQIDEERAGRMRECMGGCIHDEIAKHFPELFPLIKWHLCSTDGPMHYEANTIYHAGDRDHHGLRKGERKPLQNPKGEVFWELEAVNAPGVLISTTPTGDKYRNAETVPLFILDHDVKAKHAPAIIPVLRWVQQMIEGEGKERDLAAARSCAVWPEATDAELCQEPAELHKALSARLPALLGAFRKDVEACGFIWCD